MFLMGNTPEGVTASARKASLHVRIAVKHPDAEDDDGPYINMRVIVTEEDGKLGVGYFELRGPSILD